ncbi:MAG: thioesterase family protein [Fibrobacterota bacterium]
MPSPANEHATRLTVRYGETDQMGFVHHSAYVLYLEAARVEHLKALGLPYHDLEAEGVLLPVIELHINYFKPARFGQEITVISRFCPVRGVRLKVEYEISAGDERLVTGHTDHAFMGRNGRPLRPPEHVTARLPRI